MEIKKPAEQIIRDDVRRKRHRGVGIGLFLLGILFLFAITQLDPEGAVPAGAIALGLAVVLAGFVMCFASLKCPICDSVIYKSGACKCRPSSAARSIHIDGLKKRAGGLESDDVT